MTLISSRTVGCPVCGASRCGCTSPDYRPSDYVIEMEEPAMADDEQKPKTLEHYQVEQANGVTATYKMTEEDAKRIGAKKRPRPGSAPTEATAEPTTAAAKVRTAPNKTA